MLINVNFTPLGQTFNLHIYFILLLNVKTSVDYLCI